LARIDASFDVARQELQSDFSRKIAAQVTAVSRSFPPGSMPMAFYMQTVRASPRPPSVGRNLNEIARTPGSPRRRQARHIGERGKRFWD
jgi:hypothetical protein